MGFLFKSNEILNTCPTFVYNHPTNIKVNCNGMPVQKSKINGITSIETSTSCYGSLIALLLHKIVREPFRRLNKYVRRYR